MIEECGRIDTVWYFALSSYEAINRKWNATAVVTGTECATVAKKTHWTKLSTLMVIQAETRFTMPGKFRVIIRVANKGDEKQDISPDALAEYEHDTNVIVLRSSRTQRQRREDLQHELQHLVVEWMDHIMRKVRVRCFKR